MTQPARTLPLAALTDLCRSRPARTASTRVHAVDGPSGAGKSTLAGRLAASLRAPVVHMDDLFPGWDGLDDAVPRLLEWVLEPLGAGRSARFRRFDWPQDRYAEWHDVPPSGDLVVEGVASGAAPCRPYLSTLVWVEATPQERLRRGVDRDGETYRPNWERWAAQEAAHFAREGTRQAADVILDGELDEACHESGLVRVTRWPWRLAAADPEASGSDPRGIVGSGP